MKKKSKPPATWAGLRSGTRPVSPGRRWAGALILAAAVGLRCEVAHAMPAPPPATLETGAPSFVVLGPEALGLSTVPIDLHLLPDGRVLVVSQREIAFGDGARWEAFQEVPGQPPIFATVAVDDDGRIYAGIEGGIARVDLKEDDKWTFAPVVALNGESASQESTMVSVAALPDHWYWYGGNGAIVSWRPGQASTVVGKVGAIERIFTLAREVYVSDQASGGLFRLDHAGAANPVLGSDVLVSESVTCAIPFGPDQVLVGTGSAGLKLFDGKIFRAFGPPGLLNSGHRITDLCPTGEGFFAASIDTVGIVFFDREGRTVQVLERSLDHRLARVQRLLYARSGVLWALLNDGVARVEFPSPISHFEPLLASGLAYAQPLRHAGRLWVLADGRAMRGIYGTDGRLERFEDDTPAGRYLFTLSEVDGQLFGSNDEGIHLYETTGWRLILPGIVNARMGVARSSPEGIFYVARGEYGTIQRSGPDYVAHPVRFSGLGDSYNSEVDSTGIGWLELGMSRIGRLDPGGGHPVLTILGTAEGLTNGWPELYLLDGIARFHLANHLYRFDETRGRFMEDRELLARIPQLAVAGGRPLTDSSGRLWYTANGATQVIDRSAPGGNQPVKIMPVGFAPTSYTAQDDGVVWMFEKRRLARMDPTLPIAPSVPLRALITSVEFSASHQELFDPGPNLNPLGYADNSLVIDFAAPANPFGLPVTFEVMLEGASNQWISTGAVGSATYNRLKEGDYVFRVRPVAGGMLPGGEARLGFTVRPPWYRTPLAWVIYTVVTLSLLIFANWLSSYLQRRENERLEQLVAKRTGELNATNEQLGHQIEETTEKSTALSVSEERYRLLNAGLEDRVRERTAKLAEASGLLDAMMENTPDHIYFKDRESRLVRFSRAFATRFNVTDDTFLRGKTDFDLYSAEHAQATHEDERKIITTGEPMVGKLEKETYHDGRITWALTTKMPWLDGTGATIGTFGISKDVTAWKEAEAKLEDTHKQLLDTSRHAGMAEVATGVLHNVGNVLNSVNVSATLVADHVRHSKAVNIAKVAVLFEQNKADLAGFLTRDPRGQLIPGYLGTLGESLAAEHKTILAELDHLRKNIEHIKDIVAMQQTYARTSGVTETVSVPDMIEDALRINAGSLARHAVVLNRDYQERGVITTDKHKVMQILINLVRNAKYACDESGRTDKLIIARTSSDHRAVRIEIIDNGVGIPKENLERIFNHGFTTRKNGHGFGLHSGALAARELGGSLSVHSAGREQGATFTLELPHKPVAFP